MCAGEHLFIDSSSVVHVVQDPQSFFTSILPTIELGGVASGYNMNAHYNDPTAPGNQTAAMNASKIFLCPMNPLSSDRIGGGARKRPATAVSITCRLLTRNSIPPVPAPHNTGPRL